MPNDPSSHASAPAIPAGARRARPLLRSGSPATIALAGCRRIWSQCLATRVIAPQVHGQPLCAVGSLMAAVSITVLPLASSVVSSNWPSAIGLLQSA